MLVTNAHRSSHLRTDDARFYNDIGREFASHETTLHSNREFSRGDGNHSNTPAGDLQRMEDAAAAGSLLHEQGDLSNVVQIGRAQGNITTVQGTAGKMILAWSLIEMGYVREVLLIGGVAPFDRLVYLRRVPDRRSILAETEDLVGTSEESWLLTPLLLELARTNRHEEIVALFDRRGSAINRLQQIDDSNRTFRATLGSIIGRALLKVGRNREGVRLFYASEEATRVILANGNLSPQAMVEVAGGEAMMGRRDRALTLLERAVSRGWFAYDGLSYRIDEMPWFEGLRGDPRF